MDQPPVIVSEDPSWGTPETAPTAAGADAPGKPIGKRKLFAAAVGARRHRRSRRLRHQHRQLAHPDVGRRRSGRRRWRRRSRWAGWAGWLRRGRTRLVGDDRQRQRRDDHHDDPVRPDRDRADLGVDDRHPHRGRLDRGHQSGRQRDSAGHDLGSAVTAQQVTSGVAGLGGGARGGTQGVPPAGAPGVPPAGGANAANGAPAAGANGANRPANGAPPGAGGATGRGNGGGAPTAGVVRAVTGTGFTLTAGDGRVLTVTVSNTTTFTVTKAGSVSALEVGDQIQVNGASGGNGQITAATIRAGVLGAAGGPGAGRGGQAPAQTTVP